MTHMTDHLTDNRAWAKNSGHGYESAGPTWILRVRTSQLSEQGSSVITECTCLVACTTSCSVVDVQPNLQRCPAQRAGRHVLR